MNRTCAPRRPPAWGRSTRIGYQLGPSPTISATLLHVRPESPENWITPSCSGVNVDPLCLVHSCSQTAVRPRRSMGGEVNVSKPPAAYHEYLPAPGALTLSRHHPRHPLSSGSAPASDTSSAETLVPTARNARTASRWRSVRQSVRSTPRRRESVCTLRSLSAPVPVRSVSDSGREALASRLSQESGQREVNRGTPGTSPDAPGARARSPDASISERVNGRLSRHTRSTSALSSGNSKPSYRPCRQPP